MNRLRSVVVAALVTAAAAAGCTPGVTGSRPRTSTSAPAAPSASAPGPSRTAGSSGTRPRVRAQVLHWRLPHPLSRAVAMPYGHGVILAGGLGPGDRSTNQVLRLNLHRGVIGHPGRLTRPLHDAAGAVLAGRPTVLGGGGATELDDVQRMDRRYHWRRVGRLPGARSDLSVVGVPGGLSVLGGYDGSRTPTAVLRTPDASRFEVATRLRSGVRYAGVARSNRVVWILGGERDGRELDQVLRWDTRTGLVRLVGHLPRPLGHEAVTAVGHRLLVMGGRTAPDAVTDQLWWYQPARNRWTRAGRLPYPVADAPSVTVGDSALLFGGETPDFTARVTRVSWG